MACRHRCGRTSESARTRIQPEGQRILSQWWPRPSTIPGSIQASPFTCKDLLPLLLPRLRVLLPRMCTLPWPTAPRLQQRICVTKSISGTTRLRSFTLEETTPLDTWITRTSFHKELIASSLPSQPTSEESFPWTSQSRSPFPLERTSSACVNSTWSRSILT